MIRLRIATHPVVLRKVDATITRPLAPSDTRDAVHREWATRPLGIAQGSDGQRQPASSVRLMPRGFPDLSWHADGPGCSGGAPPGGARGGGGPLGGGGRGG